MHTKIKCTIITLEVLFIKQTDPKVNTKYEITILNALCFMLVDLISGLCYQTPQTLNLTQAFWSNPQKRYF